MRARINPSKFWRQTKGTAVVEFALVAGLLLLLVMGILDFGHAWFMRATIVNASREAARYGVVLTDPRRTANDIETVVTNYLTPVGITATTVVSGAGTGNLTGSPLTVVVTTTKTWFAVNSMVRLFGGDLGNTIRLEATTTMLNE